MRDLFRTMNDCVQCLKLETYNISIFDMHFEVCVTYYLKITWSWLYSD